MEHHNLLLKPEEELKIEIDLSHPSWVPESNTEDFSPGQSVHPNSQRNETISIKNEEDKNLVTVHIQHLNMDTGKFEMDPIFQSLNDPLLYVNSWSINRDLDEKARDLQKTEKIVTWSTRQKSLGNPGVYGDIRKLSADGKPPKKRKLPRGTYVCDYCKKKFVMRTSIVRHIKIHTGIGVYRCDVCGDIFPTYCKLETHNMIVHTGERPFVCEICNAGFTQKYTMEDHKLIHSGKRPFKCTICGKNFVRQRNLSAHMKLHNSKKEHECDICMRKFSVKSNMTKHRLRHDNLVPKRFFCDFCERTYEQRGHLEDHMRKHTGEKPFKCNSCRKKFARLGSLTLHIKRHHTEVISIECRFCDKVFNHERALKMHMMTHRGEKPYKCNVCKKGFVRRGDRNRHVSTHQIQPNVKLEADTKNCVSE